MKAGVWGVDHIFYHVIFSFISRYDGSIWIESRFTYSLVSCDEFFKPRIFGASTIHMIQNLISVKSLDPL